jgi:cephalosporin hydroxylase
VSSPAEHRPAPRLHWSQIHGWFGWRDLQEEAAATFPAGSTFVEVGCYLGRSLCSLAEVVRDSDREFTVVGVDYCQGSGPEGTTSRDAHAAAVAAGDGTLAGQLHRNIIECGFADRIHLVVSPSPAAAALFADESLAWVHLDARHEYDSVLADIDGWLPKVAPGGWLSGDDYNEQWWPGVVAAVQNRLPDAHECSTQQWRWIKPQSWSR